MAATKFERDRQAEETAFERDMAAQPSTHLSVIDARCAPTQSGLPSWEGPMRLFNGTVSWKLILALLGVIGGLCYWVASTR